MIAYVMTKEPKLRISEINEAVRVHPLMGNKDELSAGAPIVSIDEVQISRHAKAAIQLIHLFVDMRAVYGQKVGILKP